MIQGESTSPGYCLLLQLDKDYSQPSEYLSHIDMEIYRKDDLGNFLWKNIYLDCTKMKNVSSNGPAFIILSTKTKAKDIVIACPFH